MNLSHERTPANGRPSTEKGTFFGGAFRAGLMTLGLILVAVIGVQASGNSVGTMPSMAAPTADQGGLNDSRSIYLEGPRGMMQDVLLSANGYGTIQVVPCGNGRIRFELRGEEVLAVFNPEVILMSDIEIGLVNSDVAMSVTAVMSGGMMTPVSPLSPAEDTPLPVKAWILSGILLNDSPVIHTVIYSNPVKRIRHKVSMTNGLLQIHQIQD
tara:strand:- start:8717 stop:9352 length:636 start_codon:yes stop_codon:yes gene_type:complete